MTKRKVIIELAHHSELAAHAFAAAASPATSLDTATVPKIASVAWDATFAPTVLQGQLPRPLRGVGYESGIAFDLAPAEQSTFIVRAEVEESKLADVTGHKQVVGVFADVEIEPAIICPGSPALGTDADVDRLLCGPQMRGAGMDGSGVLLAIVDTGINLAHLQAHGRPIQIDAARSWVPVAGMIPGQAPVNHGTMCAFDAAICAPRATFLDIQVLRSQASGPTPMSGVLSDAVRAYAHLLAVLQAPRRPGDLRSLVVSNSWGMFHPSWDFPVGNPGNYSDNPNHPFNRIVAVLERAGADILFAAGNCGRDCPDGRCGGVTANAMYGANSHPSVISVAGVDVTRQRVGYSTQGPGRLARNKPDVCGYTHFRGSGVYPADGGTSAATPVVAGVVAAVRSKRPLNPSSPATRPSAIRALLRSTAVDLEASGFDFDTGYGVVDGCALYRRLRGPVLVDLCRRFPQLCQPVPVPPDFCTRFPQLCQPVPQPPNPPLPVPPQPPLPPVPPHLDALDADAEEAAAHWAYAAWRSGLLVPAQTVAQPAPAPRSGCGCGAGCGGSGKG